MLFLHTSSDLTAILVRIATQDDVVPLATPFTDIYGTVHETLK
jgi:hypothetical protein